MDIELMPEIMIGSLSTQDSKNMHLSNDSNFNLINLNFANSRIIPSTSPNLLLYEEQKMNVENDQSPKQSQDQQNVPNSLDQNPNPNLNKQTPEEEKKILNNEEKKSLIFNFHPKKNIFSFLVEYLNDIYSNFLEDEKNLKVKPNREYMNQQGDINLLIGKKY